MKKLIISLFLIATCYSVIRSNYITDHPILTSLIAYNTFVTIASPLKKSSSYGYIGGASLLVVARSYNTMPHTATIGLGLFTYGILATSSIIINKVSGQWKTYISDPFNRKYFNEKKLVVSPIHRSF